MMEKEREILEKAITSMGRVERLIKLLRKGECCCDVASCEEAQRGERRGEKGG